MRMQIWVVVLGILFSLIGIALVIVAFTRKKPKYSFQPALQVEGTVIDLGIRQPRPFKKRRFSEPAYSQVTIEFLTHTNKSIQGDIDTNLTQFYSGQYKVGDKVNLVYNPENPTEFIVTSLQSTKTAMFILIFAGLFLLMTGIGMALINSYLSFMTK